eukprot:GHVQ01004225.1.p1 GENE.GHVQ01004225.1~~GHVQ01004225.1.p1  ORF type:complete len:508 (-),score=37.71 GHVQ01004225.1:321-1844(-)
MLLRQLLPGLFLICFTKVSALSTHRRQHSSAQIKVIPAVSDTSYHRLSLSTKTGSNKAHHVSGSEHAPNASLLQFSGGIKIVNVIPTGEGINLAYKGNAEQTGQWGGGEPKYAVDADYEQNYNKDYHCAHTGKETNAYWKVDLGAEFRIFTVALLPRNDDSKTLDRFQDYGIYISNSWSFTNSKECAYEPNHDPSSVRRVYKCKEPIVGSYVKVQFPHKKQYLTICEVEVMTENIALRQRVTLSSTSPSGQASYAVDGNFGDEDGKCAETEAGDTNARLVVDFQESRQVRAVALSLGTDVTTGSNVRVTVGDDPDIQMNPVCNIYNGGGRESFEAPLLFCDSTMAGQYVSVERVSGSQPLKVCEVHVIEDTNSYCEHWDSWSPCSVTCGDGVQTKRCNDPASAPNGRRICTESICAPESNDTATTTFPPYAPSHSATATEVVTESSKAPSAYSPWVIAGFSIAGVLLLVVGYLLIFRGPAKPSDEALLMQYGQQQMGYCQQNVMGAY